MCATVRSHGAHREQIRSPPAAHQGAHQKLGHRCGVWVKRLSGGGKMMNPGFSDAPAGLAVTIRTRRGQTRESESKTMNRNIAVEHFLHDIAMNESGYHHLLKRFLALSWMRCASRLMEGKPSWTLQKQLCWSKARRASTARKWVYVAGNMIT